MRRAERRDFRGDAGWRTARWGGEVVEVPGKPDGTVAKGEERERVSQRFRRIQERPGRAWTCRRALHRCRGGSNLFTSFDSGARDRDARRPIHRVQDASRSSSSPPKKPRQRSWSRLSSELRRENKTRPSRGGEASP